MLKNISKYKLIALIALFALLGMQMKSTGTISLVAPAESVRLPVLMYHGFTQNGKESTFVVRAAELEKDIVYLQRNGFEFVTIRDLINFADSKAELPPKPVMLTFDDGYMNNYTYAYPILKKYGAKAVISPIAYYSDLYSGINDSNPSYSHMTWTIIGEMASSGLVEFENHSYNLHSFSAKRHGSSKNKGESSDSYRKLFFEDMQKAHSAIQQATGTAPLAYTYPFGSISKETISILKCCGYRVSFSCTEGYNYIHKDKDCLFALKRFNRTPKESAAFFLSAY